jgi:esterase/lipase
VLDNLPKVTIPTLVANYAGDNAIYPVYADTIYERCPANDKSRAQFDGDHFGLSPAGTRNHGEGSAATVILEWLQNRFPSRSG